MEPVAVASPENMACDPRFVTVGSAQIEGLGLLHWSVCRCSGVTSMDPIDQRHSVSGIILSVLIGLAACSPAVSATADDAGMTTGGLPIQTIPDGGLTFTPVGQDHPAAMQACQTWLAANGRGDLVAPILRSNTGNYAAVTTRQMVLLKRGTCDAQDRPYLLATAVTDASLYERLAHVVTENGAGTPLASIPFFHIAPEGEPPLDPSANLYVVPVEGGHVRVVRMPRTVTSGAATVVAQFATQDRTTTIGQELGFWSNLKPEYKGAVILAVVTLLLSTGGVLYGQLHGQSANASQSSIHQPQPTPPSQPTTTLSCSAVDSKNAANDFTSAWLFYKNKSGSIVKCPLSATKNNVLIFSNDNCDLTSEYSINWNLDILQSQLQQMYNIYIGKADRSSWGPPGQICKATPGPVSGASQSLVGLTLRQPLRVCHETT
jgi:hypothetical protein